MQLRKLHFVVGLAGVVAFLVTGAYMRAGFPDLYAANEVLRYLYRSNHVYVLLASLVNVALGVHLTPAPPGWRATRFAARLAPGSRVAGRSMLRFLSRGAGGLAGARSDAGRRGRSGSRHRVARARRRAALKGDGFESSPGVDDDLVRSMVVGGSRGAVRQRLRRRAERRRNGALRALDSARRGARAAQGAHRGRQRDRAAAGRLRLLRRSRACGTRSRTCSPTTARSRSASTASTSARQRVREYLYALGGGRQGLVDGELNEHLQVMPVITLAPDGLTAKARWRAITLTGELGGDAFWGEGPYENEYVKDGGVWKIKTLHWYQALLRAVRGRLANESRSDGREVRLEHAAARSAAVGRVQDVARHVRAAVQLSESRRQVRGGGVGGDANDTQCNRSRRRGRDRHRGMARPSRGVAGDRIDRCARGASRGARARHREARGRQRDQEAAAHLRLLHGQAALVRSRRPVLGRRQRSRSAAAASTWAATAFASSCC